MEKSPSIAKLATALLSFQSSIDKVSKDAANPFFKSKYASLSNILETIQAPMKEAGLCVSQMPDGDSLTTILIHAESGEYIQATYNIHPKSIDPQGIGSAITYARRYALGAILSLNIDEDDDGNAAMKPAKPNPLMQEINAAITKLGNVNSKEEMKDFAATLPDHVKTDMRFRNAASERTKKFPIAA